MRLPWLDVFSDGTLRPAVVCGLRRLPRTLTASRAFIIDTGADSTTLPLSLADPLGFQLADLGSSTSAGLGGSTQTWRPKSSAGASVELLIDSKWYRVDDLQFAPACPPLLGRDVLFREFEMHMRAGMTELIPLSKP